MVAELAGASPLSRPALSPPSAPEAGALPAMPLRAGATMAPELKQEQAVVSTVAETPARGPASPFDFITCVVVLVATVAYASAWHTGLTWWREASFADMPHTRPDAEIHSTDELIQMGKYVGWGRGGGDLTTANHGP